MTTPRTQRLEAALGLILEASQLELSAVISLYVALEIAIPLCPILISPLY